MTRTRLKPNVVSILVAIVALIAATMVADPAHAAEDETDIERFGSVAEFEKYDTGPDEYKFTAEPAEDGSVTIDVEPGEGQTLEVDSDGNLNFLDKSGDKEFQLENLSAVGEHYPEATIGDWELTDSGARVQVKAPAEVQSAFEKSSSCNDPDEAGVSPAKSLDTQSAYSNCMLEHGIEYGVATAISTCVAGSFAAGVGCVAGILPGATGGYISGLVVGLWDCKDKL